MKLVMRFAVLALCSIALGLVDGALTKLSTTQLEEITSHQWQSSAESNDSPLWIVRFIVPWEDAAAAASTFQTVADAIPSEIANFGVYELDSPDTFAMADALAIASFPTIRAIGARVGRPQVPKGLSQTPRVIRFDNTNSYGGSHTDSKSLLSWVYQAAPNRYIHPVSDALIPTLWSVSSMKSLKEIAPKVGSSVPSIVFFSRSAETNIAWISTLHSQGARLKGRCALGFSSNSPLARELGATIGGENGLGAIVTTVNERDEVKATPDSAQATLKTPKDIADYLNKHCLPREPYEKKVKQELENWKKHMAEFHNSPLRKLDTSEQFDREIVASGQIINVVFLLRETDKFFSRHIQVASEVAEFQQQIHHTSILTGEPLTQQFRIEVFWIDAEIHPEIAKAMMTPQVPSIAITIPLKDQMTGIKYYSEDKNFPSADKLLKYLQSERLLDTKEIRPLQADAVRFTDRPTRKSTAPPKNNQYLNIDRRSYQQDVEPPNILQEILTAIEEEAKESKSSSKKLSPEAEKKKKAKAEALKEKFKAELEKKNKELEERIKAKAAQDAADKAAAEAELAKRKLEAEKNPKPKVEKPKKEKAKKAKAPAKRKQKPPRDLMAELTRWEQESRLMADKFVSVKDGKVVVHHSLTPPVKP